MFKNRSFLVTMVDDKKPTDEDKEEFRSQPIDYEDIVATVAGGVMVAVGFYILADTARQVAIYTAMARIPKVA